MQEPQQAPEPQQALGFQQEAPPAPQQEAGPETQQEADSETQQEADPETQQCAEPELPLQVVQEPQIEVPQPGAQELQKALAQIMDVEKKVESLFAVSHIAFKKVS